MGVAPRRWLGVAPALTLVVMLGPVAAGLAGVVLPAFGYLPALGGDRLTLEPWQALAAEPGLWRSIRLSLTVGLATTLVALAAVVLFCAAWHGTRLFRAVERALAPVLAVPHVAAAVGLAFLIAPSGFLVRLMSPWATGFERPPDLLILNDPDGLALMAGLVIKEVPFLLLMVLSALTQTNAARLIAGVRTLGYGRTVGWLKAVLPQIYPQIRLPVFAVLAYGTAVVDTALILGPTTPAPLAVRLFGWAHDPDLALRFQASAAAVLLLGLVAAAIGLWLALERPVAWLGRRWAEGGGRFADDRVVRWVAALPVAGCVVLVGAGILVLGLWSVAGLWRFPAALPDGWTLATWAHQADDLVRPVATSFALSATAAVIALGLAVGCLEHAVARGAGQGGRRSGWDGGGWLVYLPLLVPQVAFLFGVQVLLARVGGDQTWPAVVWGHLVFVVPYVLLALGEPYRAWDARYGQVARGLGAGPMRVLFAVKLPMLLGPLAIAAAVGFAVGIGQYLVTVLIGGGRFATVTTEAVVLAAGGDRRLIGVYAMVQMLLPLVGFTVALALPAWVWRRRRGLGGGGER